MWFIKHHKKSKQANKPGKIFVAKADLLFKEHLKSVRPVL